MQDKHFTKHYTLKTHFLLLVLRFEDHYRFLMLFLNKYLNINRIKSFDLNTVKKAAESKSKVSKSDSEILPVVIVS